MFVKKKLNCLRKSMLNRFIYTEPDISFKCLKKMPGFTVGNIYKPFAYSINTAGDYTNFAIFDDNNRIMLMERHLIKKNCFRIIFKIENANNDYLNYQKDLVREMEMENGYEKRYGKNGGNKGQRRQDRI